jgi:YVTN family beta-propeller protein
MSQRSLGRRRTAAVVWSIGLLGVAVAAANPPQTTAVALTPIQSSPVALTPDGRRLANLNPEAGTLTLFDVSADNPVRLAEFRVGGDPVSVAVDPTGATGYVANSLSGNVAVVDLNRRFVRAVIQAGAEPSAVAVSPNGTRLYVANSASNNLMVFDTARLTRVATVDLSSMGTAPRAIAVTNNGDGDDSDETIFVALFFAHLRPGKGSLEEGQDDQRQGIVVAISANTFTPAPIELEPLAITGFNSNGRLAPAAGQTPSLPSTNPQTFTTPTGAFPNQLASVAIQPGQTRAYVVSTGASPNGPFRFNSNAQGLVSVFDTQFGTEITAAQTDPNVRRTAPLNLNRGINLATTPAPRLFLSNPVAMAWRPDGSDAWIAVQQADLIVRLTVDGAGIPTIGAPLVAGPSSIVRVDLDPEPPVPGQIAGKAPRGIAINNAGTRAYVSNFISRSVSVVDISNPTGPTIVGTGQSSALPIPRTFAATAHRGAELFYSGRGPQGRMSSEAWGGCIACHPGGRSDNVTWMFDTGPRQTIPLDGMFRHSLFNPDQRILNWSAVRDEVQDFELNTRNVFGGRGLIDDDRLFLAIGGANGPVPTDISQIEQFQQVTGVVSTTNDLTGGALPGLATPRRDFGVATLDDDRVFIIGGRTGPGQGSLVTGADTVVEFNPRTNQLTPRRAVGFTARHSLGAAAVRTARGPRIYAIGGYASTDAGAAPVGIVEEYNPATDSWRPVSALPTAVAQFGTAVAGGINTAEPLQLVHVVSGNTGSEAAPVVANPNPIQRFQADPVMGGTWTTFSPAGLTLRRNHGAATAIRGVTSRVFVVGGQDAAGTVLSTVEEYLAQTVVAVATPHTNLPAPRARFGVAGSLSTNQIYAVGGIDGTGADQTTVFEYTIAANGPVAGPPGTPSGTWVTRANLSAPRRGLGLSNPPGVTNFLPARSSRRDEDQDAIAVFCLLNIRSARAPVLATNPAARRGRILFGKPGLVVQNVSCASCHGGPQWTRSRVDFFPPPSPEIGLGFGNQRVIGAELRQTVKQGTNVLIDVGTFTLAGRQNEIRFNGADISQAVAPLGVNGFNIPSLLSVHETPPYFYNGLAQTLEEVLNGSQDGNGGTRVHFVTDPNNRADLIQFLRSIDQTTPLFP